MTKMTLQLTQRGKEALIYLNENQYKGLNQTKLARGIDTTYAYTCMLIYRLIDKELIQRIKKDKREYNLILTKKGKKMSELLKEMENIT